MKIEIEKYILKNKDNLRIAATVGEAWPEVMEKLAGGFLDQLDSRLMRKLKGWKFARWERFFIDSYPEYDFWKPAWNEQYYVTLQFNDYGREMNIGLMRDESQKHISKRPRCAEVIAAVRKYFPSASERTWWEARIPMSSPAADWRGPEVLWRMYHKDPKFLDDVAEQLLKVARICEPIVDELARRK